MGSKQSKELRQQIRAVVKEFFPEIFTKEVQDTMLKSMNPLVEEGLKAIQEHVMRNVKQYQDGRSDRENELLVKASDHLVQMNIVFRAWQELISESLKDACVVGDDFNSKLDERVAKLRAEMVPPPEASPEEPSIVDALQSGQALETNIPSTNS